MMQDHLFDMINDGHPFGMMFISGLPSHFGMRGNDLHFEMHTDLSQIALQIYRQSHFGMIAEPSFRNDGYDYHFGMAFRFILDLLLDLWLIFSE